jgi:hypothetical protein
LLESRADFDGALKQRPIGASALVAIELAPQALRQEVVAAALGAEGGLERHLTARLGAEHEVGRDGKAQRELKNHAEDGWQAVSVWRHGDRSGSQTPR